MVERILTSLDWIDITIQYFRCVLSDPYAPASLADKYRRVFEPLLIARENEDIIKCVELIGEAWLN